MTQLRILAIGNMYPPQHAGGYELAWQQVMRRAREVGHRTRVLTSDYQADSSVPEDDPDVHRTLRWYWDLERYEFPRLNLAERLVLERHNAAELRRHLEIFRPDMVAWWSMGCMSLSLIELVRRARLPAIFVVHDDWLVYGSWHDQWMRTWVGPRRTRVGRALERVCGIPIDVELSSAGPFVFNSRYTLERAREAGVEGPRMTIVHPGIEDRFLNAVAPRPWGWRLLYVGRIDRQKGLDTAVSALAHLPPETTLTVRGSGDERYVGEMIALAQRLEVEDRVRFDGFAAGDELIAAYANSDAVVFPVRWNEPFGLVPLEAMGLGRPLVSTSRGGTAEFVSDGVNALVFEPDDDRGLAACIERVATDPPLRSRLISEGRRTAARYTAAEFAERTLDQIVRVVEGPCAKTTTEVGA